MPSSLSFLVSFRVFSNPLKKTAERGHPRRSFSEERSDSAKQALRLRHGILRLRFAPLRMTAIANSSDLKSGTRIAILATR